MYWDKLLYLTALIFIAYTPYKFLQYKSRLLNITLKNACLLTSILIITGSLLASEVELSSIMVSWPIVLGLMATFLLWILSPYIIPRIGRYPKRVLGAESKLYMISLRPPVLILKLFEILFQEVFFLYALSMVLAGLSYESKILYFTLFNLAIHAGNIPILRNRLILMITALSVPMGVLFSVLILNGYVLVTTTIHIAFYLLLTTYYWTDQKYS